MIKFLKYVILLFAVGFFAHSGWLYWFAYSTGSPFAEAIGPYHRAADAMGWGAFFLLSLVILKQHADLEEARAGKDRPE
jgi:hypothetical protein